MATTLDKSEGLVDVNGHQASANSEGQTRSRSSAWTRLRRDVKGQIGGALLLVVVLSAVAAPLLVTHDPEHQDVMNKLMPPVWQGGELEHPLGTDSLGRDILARTLYGGRMSLMIGVLVTVAAGVLGSVLGILAGYFGRHADAVIMRITDIQMAFPGILLALSVMVMLGPGLVNLVLVLTITGWVEFSRILRADVLSIKHREFMEAGRATGSTHLRLMSRYVLPNLVGSITVIATLAIARTIITESSLSFLGLGVQPPTPSWGGMISEGRGYLATAWWISTIPGIALLTTVVAVNLVGDALRDALDPRVSSS